jgi:hypothetical protein
MTCRTKVCRIERRIAVQRACLVLLVALALLPSRARGETASYRAELTFQVEANVSAEDRAGIQEGIRFAQDYFAATLGVDLSQPVTVAIQQGADASSSAYAAGHTLTFSTEHHVWRDSSALHRTKIAVHESFHILQSELDRGRTPGPVWLLEGSAEYVAWQAVIAKGLVADGPIRDRWIRATQNGAVSEVPLKEMESPTMPQEVRCCLYEVAPLAVEQLVAGPGLRSLRTYFEAIGDGASWQAAFEQAFGQTPETFYETFEVVRWQLAPAGYDVTSVLFPFELVHGAAEVGIVSVSSPIERGEQAALIAATAPGIPCTLDFASVTGKHLLTQPTHAGPDGTVFWLWSLRPRLARGMATVTIDCGGAPATAGVEIR